MITLTYENDKQKIEVESKFNIRRINWYEKRFCKWQLYATYRLYDNSFYITAYNNFIDIFKESNYFEIKLSKKHEGWYQITFTNETELKML